MNRISANILILLAVTIVLVVSVVLFVYALSLSESSEQVPVFAGSAIGLAGALWLGSYIWRHKDEHSE